MSIKRLYISLNRKLKYKQHVCAFNLLVHIGFSGHI